MPPQADTRWTEPKKLLVSFTVGEKKVGRNPKRVTQPSFSPKPSGLRFHCSMPVGLRAVRSFALAVRDGELVGRREAASVVSASDAVDAPVQIAAARVARAVSVRELCCPSARRGENCARSPRHSARAMVSGGYQLLATGHGARLCVRAPEGYDSSSSAGNLPARRRGVVSPDSPPQKEESDLL